MTDSLDEQVRSAIARARLADEAATKGLWDVARVDHDDGEISFDLIRSAASRYEYLFAISDAFDANAKHDASFIAAARTEYPTIASLLERVLAREAAVVAERDERLAALETELREEAHRCDCLAEEIGHLRDDGQALLDARDELARQLAEANEIAVAAQEYITSGVDGRPPFSTRSMQKLIGVLGRHKARAALDAPAEAS